MKRIILLGLAALLALPFLLGPAFAEEPVSGVAEMAYRAHGDLDTQLRDYPGARFRNTHLMYSMFRGLPHYVFCGEINPRNAAGGFVGWTTFMVNDQGGVVVNDPQICGPFPVVKLTRQGDTDYSVLFQADWTLHRINEWATAHS